LVVALHSFTSKLPIVVLAVFGCLFQLPVETLV
jgi:hypothetical protein